MSKRQRRLCFSIPLVILLCSCASTMKAPSLMALENSGERMIAYNAYLTFSVKNIDSTRIGVIEKCRKNDGFVTRETTDSLTLRIPMDNFKLFINELKETGEISQSEIRGEDITDSYSDIALQLESKKQLRDRYNQILAKADKVDDLISIEKELERINLEIQRLEGLKLDSENNVKYITVNITIKKQVTPGPLGWFFYIGYKAIEWLFVWK